MIRKIYRGSLSKNVLLPFVKGQRFIFIYHDISFPDLAHHSPHYSTRPEVFLRQLDFLQKHFSIIGLDEIVSADVPGNKNYASITFDDGFQSVFDVAYPILKERNIPFTVFANKMAIVLNLLWVSELALKNAEFITRLQREYGNDSANADVWMELLKGDSTFNRNITGYFAKPMQGKRMYMDAESIKALKQNKVIIGSHTISHPVLSMCDSATVSNELMENKKYLDDLLDQDTIHFALPFGKKGHFNKANVDLITKTGHQYIYTSNPAGFKGKRSGLIPRIGVTAQTAQELMFIVNRQFLQNIDI